jgi:DNA-binding NtrC family response regulator
MSANIDKSRLRLLYMKETTFQPSPSSGLRLLSRHDMGRPISSENFIRCNCTFELPIPAISLSGLNAAFESWTILRLIELFHGDNKQVCKVLKISQRHLAKKCAEYGIAKKRKKW